MSSVEARWIVAGAVTLGSVAGLVLIDRVLVRSGPPADALVVVPAVLAAAAAAVVAGGWPWTRRRLAPVTAAVAGISLIAALLHRPHVIPREAFWILTGEALLLLLFSLSVRWAAGRDVLVLGVMATAAGTLTVLRVTDPSSALEAVGVVCTWGVVAAGPVTLGLYLRVLDTRRSRLVTAARHAQRLELAHDLHDFVAHDVTGMVVQAQAAQVVATRDPGEAISALEGIEKTGLHALDSLDRTVHALRNVPSRHGGSAAPPSEELDTAGAARVPGVEDIFHLVGRFSTTDRLPVHLHVEPVPEIHNAPEVSSTAYRVVREALTNVRRHAPGAVGVEVHVRRSVGAGSASMVVSVTNRLGESWGSGRGVFQDGSRPHGVGLVGLAERVEGIGGTLVAGPLDGGRALGWRVTAELPLREPARA